MKLATTKLEQTLTRSLTDIEPKLTGGAVGSSVVGLVELNEQHFGLQLPLWVNLLIVIGAYFLAGYLKRSRIPALAAAASLLPTPDAGSADAVAVTAGADLAAGKPIAEAVPSFESVVAGTVPASTVPAGTPAPSA